MTKGLAMSSGHDTEMASFYPGQDLLVCPLARNVSTVVKVLGYEEQVMSSTLIKMHFEQ